MENCSGKASAGVSIHTSMLTSTGMLYGFRELSSYHFNSCVVSRLKPISQMYFLVTKISPERSRFWYLGPVHAVDVKKISTGSFKLTFLLFLRDEHLDNTLLMPCTPRLLKHAQNKAALINGTVKRAAKTCKLFLLKSNVARFTTYKSNLSCNKSGCCK